MTMRVLFKCMAAVLLMVGIVCGVLAWKEIRPYRQEQKENHTLRETVVLPGGQGKEHQNIDFEMLFKINPDIAGWIQIPGTAVDYPVLIGEEDETYLKKDFEGRESPLGSIFAFADTKRDFSEAHICLFGHNMKRASMFGELKYYKEESYAKEHDRLFFYTPNGKEEYRLFSVYECKKDSPIYEHKMQAESPEFSLLLDRLLYEGVPGSGRMVKERPKRLLTLSTCSDYDRTIRRFTVHFAKIEE